MDIQCDSEFVIAQEHMDAAIKFGVEQIDATDVRKYIVAFMRNLLLQRAKVDQNVLENYLSRAVVKQWQEMLSTLEEKKPKVDQYPERKSHLHDVLFDKDVQTSNPG